jgi:amidase/aspartyl-tRNA(Asn)/glutamyl-tRNA(Gln) amidotransferase subunit A
MNKPADKALIAVALADELAYVPVHEPVEPSEINGEAVDPLIGWCLTYFVNLTGHPAASIPAGLADGLPVGMQIIGRRNADADVLAASAAFERLRPWRDSYRLCRERSL